MWLFLCKDLKTPSVHSLEPFLTALHISLPIPQLTFVCSEIKDEYRELANSHVPNVHNCLLF